ncbi:MAG: hypothetical protein COA73_07005 [Candidatus Hydrogenedentota bacterium]|nr:MAG: hypothetical protein COA73_14135 [Candidatus Hydrogenedentota bacterium]PCJ61974.1 MAG: hypothetical protein COA73_07270 [Candidatus Hydrogenedentota bacterium]PCJ62190.1 MAG: hypothetical protein COA73_07005 [Candidatus Hydrogenedentota bacterium]
MTKPTPYILIAALLLFANPSTSEPPLKITGAFGIKLGEVHDPSKIKIEKTNSNRETNNLSYSIDPPKPSLPFHSYDINITAKSRRIFSISATAFIEKRETALQYFNNIGGIIAEFYDKNVEPVYESNGAELIARQGEKRIILLLVEIEDGDRYMLMINYLDNGMAKVNEFEKAKELGINLDSF